MIIDIEPQYLPPLHHRQFLTDGDLLFFFCRLLKPNGKFMTAVKNTIAAVLEKKWNSKTHSKKKNPPIFKLENNLEPTILLGTC